MKKTFLKILPLISFLLPVLANATNGTNALYQKLCPGANGNDPGCIDISSQGGLINILLTIIGYLRSIFWIVAVGMLLYAAYLYLLSGTNEGNVKKARQIFTGAIIGMVLALIATSLPFLVKSFFQPSS